MRTGTWNLDGRWGDKHAQLLQSQTCDVWLLTEVRADVCLQGYQRHVTAGLMVEAEAKTKTQARHWAGVFSRAPLAPLTDEPHLHPASAAAVVDGTVYCSSILPWRTCTGPPWNGSNHAEKMGATLKELHDNLKVLRSKLPRSDLVWGGDWNQGLIGPERTGSAEGRRHLLAAIDHLGLQVPTAGLCHQLNQLASIDHVALGGDHVVTRVERILTPKLSDHDAYVVEVA